MPKMMSKADIQEIGASMVSDMEKELRLIRDIDKAFNIEYQLDPDIKAIKWVREIPPTDGFDAIAGGGRIIAGNRPKVSVDPYSADKLTREVMNFVEKWLEWQLTGSPDDPSDVAHEVAQSALLYDQAYIETIHLPWQYKANKTEDPMIKAMREESLTHSQFDFSVHHPEAAYIRQNGRLVESVLLREITTPAEMKMRWGNKARSLIEKSKDMNKRFVSVYEYRDWSHHYVWGIPTTDRSNPEDADAPSGLLINKSDRVETFLPWTAVVGGNKLNREGRRKRKPLLYAMVKSGQDLDKFVIDSLSFSASAATAAGPQIAIKNASGDTRIEYWNPFRILNLAPGEEIVNIELSNIDPALQYWSTEMGQRMEKSGLSSVLRGGTPPGGVAFQSLNLMSQSALKTLTPAKNITEKALAATCNTMLKWMKMTNTSLKIPGAKLVIKPDDIPVNPYIKVKMTEDAPIDHLQQVTSSINMVRDLGYSKGRALELMNENPDEVFKESIFEKLVEVEVGNVMASKQLKAQALNNLEMQGLNVLGQMSQDPNMMPVLQKLQEAIIQAAQNPQPAGPTGPAGPEGGGGIGGRDQALGPDVGVGPEEALSNVDPALGEPSSSGATGNAGGRTDVPNRGGQ